MPIKLTRISNIFIKQAGILSDIGHVFLDVAGLIPGIGELADMSNTLWYLSEGDYLFAALSLISIIPEIGDLIGKGGKLAVWIEKTFPKGAKTIGKYGPEITNNIRMLRGAIASNRELIEKLFEKAGENERLSEYVPRMREALGIFDEKEDI